MKQYFLYQLILFCCVLLFAGCEEEINLDLADGRQKIVIEGNIESGKFAEVIITNNSPFTEAIDFASIVVRDAFVVVSNGAINDTLRLDTLLTTAVPFLYVGTKIKGVPGHSYSLTVMVAGKVYSAFTSLPYPIALDTVYWKAAPPHNDLGTATAHLTDPVGYGNAYKWFVKRPTRLKTLPNGKLALLNRRYVAPIGSTFNDKYIDGKKFEFSYYRPYDPTEVMIADNEEDDEKGLYKKKDTIYIKFCTLDADAAMFYKTFESSASSNGNPFSSPSSIIGNISGGALGVWAGFGATYDTIFPIK